MTKSQIVTALRAYRSTLRESGSVIKALRKEHATLFPSYEAYCEYSANIMLAYRHLEDCIMRLGKAIQAADGGVSIYQDGIGGASNQPTPSLTRREVIKIFRQNRPLGCHCEPESSVLCPVCHDQCMGKHEQPPVDNAHVEAGCEQFTNVEEKPFCIMPHPHFGPCRADCTRPPEGWYCTRPFGHSGPCAADRK